MEKIASLRAALVAANPHFAGKPELLKIWVETGRLITRRTRNLGIFYRYTAKVYIEDYTSGPDQVMLPLVLWLRTNQPDLLLAYDKEEEAIKFATDINDDASWDIAIQFELTETVSVVPREDGSGWDVVHLPEPSPDDPLLPGALPDVPLAELWFGGRKLLPREDVVLDP